MPLSKYNALWLLKKPLDQGQASPSEAADYSLNYAFKRDGGRYVDTDKLQNSLHGRNFAKYTLFQLENRKLVAPIPYKGNCLVVAMYNYLVLSDAIGDSTKDEMFLGELIDEIFKLIKPKEANVKKAKKDDTGICAVRKKLEYLAANLAVDIDFSKDDFGITDMEFYQAVSEFKRISDSPLLEKRSVMSILLKLKIRLWHGWIPEDFINLPPGKGSLQILFEAKEHPEIIESWNDFIKGSQLTTKGWNDFIKGSQLTTKGLSKIKEAMNRGKSYAILYFDYDFHVIYCREGVIYILQDRAWMKLETLISKKAEVIEEAWRKVCEDREEYIHAVGWGRFRPEDLTDDDLEENLLRENAWLKDCCDEWKPYLDALNLSKFGIPWDEQLEAYNMEQKQEHD